MQYDYYFALASIPFMALTVAFYLMQSRMRDTQDRLYILMLIGGLTAVVFDFLSAALEPLGTALPQWLLYLCDLLFIVGEQLCLPAFFLFSISASGKFNKLSNGLRVLSSLPFFIVVALALISPFTTAGIFYIDAGNIYRHGLTHWTLYAATGLYMTGSCAVLVVNYRRVTRQKRRLILLFTVILMLALLLQVKFPRYLLATSAVVLALTAMYYVLRAPGEQIEPYTGALYRVLLPDMLKDMHEKHRSCTLVLYDLLNYDTLLSAGMSQLPYGLLAATSRWLHTAYEKCSVVYMNNARFAVLIEGRRDAETLRAFSRLTPATLPVDDVDVPVKLAVSALVQEADTPPEATMTTLDYLYRTMSENTSEGIFIADAAYQERCIRLSRLEADMCRILDEGVPELSLQPVKRTGSAMSVPADVLDVSLSLRHEELRDVSPEELHYALRGSGNDPWYYEHLVELIARRSVGMGASVRFCIPLLSTSLLLGEFSDILYAQTSAAGLPSKMLICSIQEKDVSGDLSVIADNLRRLKAFGFGLRLEGFAEGFTDMSMLTALPIDSVVLDPGLLHRAARSDRDLKLLGCVVRILSDIGKEVICSGADTPEDVSAAVSAGVPLLRGAMFAVSSPL